MSTKIRHILKRLSSESQSPSQSPSQNSVPTESGDYVSLQVKIRLRDGHSLAIKDASGSSDPYVKFKQGERIIYKSATIWKNLNPVWEEEFALIVEDVSEPMLLEVFDSDFFGADDFMGSADVDLSLLRYFQPHELCLALKDGEEEAGCLNLVVSILPVTLDEKNAFLSRCKGGVLAEPKKPPKLVQVWSSVVNVVLVEGRALSSQGVVPDPYVKFKLEAEKYKSKPKWLEQFDLHIFDSSQQTLEVMVIDKRTNARIGRTTIELTALPRDETVQRWFSLDEGLGALLLLISVSGHSSSDTVVDLEENTENSLRQNIIEKYNLTHSFVNLRDVGELRVKVFGARDLMAKDLGGKSDPFAVLQLVNTRLQTHTEYKTLNPQWNKLFVFGVKDIHAVLEVTVFDEDPNMKFEFLGRVDIPLLAIRNCERAWFALKDKKLVGRSKGEILLELDVIWNPVKAAIRTFNPREKKFMQKEQKFRAAVLMATVNELKLYVTAVCWVEAWHLPVALLLLFMKNYLTKRLTGRVEDERSREWTGGGGTDEDEDDERQLSPTSPCKPRGPGLAGTIASASDSLALVQNALVFVAEILQRIQNPYLSYLAIFVLGVAALILYFVPIRWLLLLWGRFFTSLQLSGVNKFTKKLRKPHAIDNNELLDFLSRVPSDKEITQQRNLRREHTKEERAQRMKNHRR